MLALGALLTAAALIVLYKAYHRPSPVELRRDAQLALGRVTREYFRSGGMTAEPLAMLSPTYWIEYEFEVEGAMHRGKERVRESYVVRVDGFTRRLGSLKEGEEIPVWYNPGDPARSTLMPDVLPATVRKSELGWGLLMVGLLLFALGVAAI